MALGSTHPLTEMSTRCISWRKDGRCVRLSTLPPSCAVVMKSGNLNLLEPFPFRRTARLGFRCASAGFVVIQMYCISGEILFTPVLLLDRPELLFVGLVWSVLAMKTKIVWDVTPCRLVNSDVSNNLIAPSSARPSSPVYDASKRR
jgi:hypothetical protein